VNRLKKVVRVLARDMAVSLALADRTNASRGTAKDIAAFYDNAERVFTRGAWLWDHETEIIAGYFPQPPSRILDVGCGAGRTSACLAELGYDVIGIDLSARLVSAAQRSFPTTEFLVMDAACMAFEDDAFDAALFSFNGLDCVVPQLQRRKVLEEIRRVVTSGGRLYLSSHNILGKLRRGQKGMRGLALWVHECSQLLCRKMLSRRLLDWYWWYDDAAGLQLLYSAPPRWNIVEFEETGWLPVAVLSRQRDSAGKCLGVGDMGAMRERGHGIGWITRNEHHVQYVLQKPEARSATTEPSGTCA
jgi:ubiquinone/menaquinone biosynthesis C-methylase UbiE